MKTYPHLEHCSTKHTGEYIYAQDKKDGSNIRAEWSKKRGWYKFGTKKTIINHTDENFGDSVDLFMNKYSEGLERIFIDAKKYRNSKTFTAFMEYFGPNSFAGQHVDTDSKDVILFDICQYQKGFISPKIFIKDFQHLGIPDIVYKGILTSEFIQDVKDNRFNLEEGVMCKGTYKTKGNDVVWMAKIKTLDWLRKLKIDFGEEALLEDINNNLNCLK